MRECGRRRRVCKIALRGARNRDGVRAILRTLRRLRTRDACYSWSEDQGRSIVLYRSSTVALALAATMTATVTVQAADDAKYPDWKGQWAQILTPGAGGQNVRFDPTKAFGPAQQAP